MNIDDIRKTHAPVKALKHLRGYLDHYEYGLVLRKLSAGRVWQDPWGSWAEKNVDLLPTADATVVRLFFLGLTVPDLASLMSTRLADELVAAGLVVEGSDGGFSLGGLCVFPWKHLYLLVDDWHQPQRVQPDQVWLGEDSFFLARLSSAEYGMAVLDIGSGTGIQALVAASRGARVTATDVNDRAVTMTGWNVCLNEHEDHIEVRAGDVYQAVEGQSFDYIIANPPFAPLSADVRGGYLFADGGEDGLDVCRRILDGVPTHLAPRGQALILAGGMGDGDAPHVFGELCARSEAARWQVTLDLISRRPLEDELTRLRASLPALGTRLNPRPTDAQTTHYYAFVISIRNGVEVGRCDLLLAHSSWDSRARERRAALRAHNNVQMS